MELEQYASQFKIYPEPAAKSLWVLDYNRMVTHTRGERSKELIDSVRPNEPENVRNYRVKNFRSITRHPFTQAITNLQRTLSHSSVEITYPEKTKPFLDAPNFKRTNFLSYMQKHVVKRMIEGANGLLVWWPHNVGDASTRVDVRPIILMPKDIIHYDDEVLCFLSKEKSPVQVYRGKQWVEALEGKVYYIILKGELAKRVQIGKLSEDKYEFEPYYPNPFGEIYALPLGGDEVSKVDEQTEEEIVYFSSYFGSAVDYADECLSRHSDNQGTWISCASPLREIEPIDCAACNQNGRVADTDENGVSRGMKTCGSCGGTGYILPTSSYGVIIRPKVKAGPGDNDYYNSNRKAVEFIHPDVAILEYSGKSWEVYLNKTKDALNLLFLDEAQSGIAKEIDREDKLATLDKIAVHLYKYLIVQSIQIIHRFLFPNEDAPEVAINLPSTFVIKDESEIITDLGNLRTQGAPDFMVGELLREATSKAFGGDPVRMKMFDVQVAIDPLFTRTFNEVNQMLNTDAISERDWTIHIYAYPMISRFARETSNFTELSIEAIIAQVMPSIEEKVVIKAPDAGPQF